MRILVIGSSHSNSLKVSESYALSNFSSEIVYSVSSIEAWTASEIVVKDGCLQFAVDPKIKFSDYAPVPQFVQQLSQKAALTDFDLIVVGHTGTLSFSDFFMQYSYPGSPHTLSRIPVSRNLIESLIDPVNGYFNTERPISWLNGIKKMPNNFSLRNTLRLINENAPHAKKIYVCSHSIFKRQQVSAAYIDLFNHSRLDYYKHWANLTATLGFDFIQPPTEALEENTQFTRLEYSLQPDKNDIHLNMDYGLLLWKKIQVLL